MRLLLVSALCLVASPASAATYYVAKTGVDVARTCATAQTSGTPLLTVTKGLTCLSGGGDTLLVGPGTYAENISNNVASGSSWTSYVRIASNGGTVTIAPGAGHWGIYLGNDMGETIVTPKYIEFDGIGVDQSSEPDRPAVYFDTRGGSTPNHIRYKNAHIVMPSATTGPTIHSTTAGAIHVGDHALTTPNGLASAIEITNVEIEGTAGPLGVYVTGDNNIVEDCDIHDVAGQGVQIYDNMHVPVNNIVRNNIVHGISTAYFFGAKDGRVGCVLMLGTGQIYNNLCYDINLPPNFTGSANQPYGCMQAYSSGAGRIIANNTCYDVDGYAIDVGSGASGTVVRNNIGYTNEHDSISDAGSGTSASLNIFVNPSFTNAAGGDFTLQSGSAARDVGGQDFLLTYYNDDLTGALRNDGLFDAGAYEFDGGVVVVASDNCTRVGPSLSIVDSGGDIYSLGTGTTPTIQILKNGTQVGVITGSELLYYSSTVYAHRNDGNWYHGATLTTSDGASDPSGTNCGGAAVLVRLNQRWWMK